MPLEERERKWRGLDAATAKECTMTNDYGSGPAYEATGGGPGFPPAGGYPVKFDARYPAQLSRWLIFVKWLLVIPHFIVLWFLHIAAFLVTVVAWFVILFTGRYPRGMFEFVAGVLRWTNRASAYYLLMTDEYPPFRLED
jgi:hypothetical protein